RAGVPISGSLKLERRLVYPGEDAIGATVELFDAAGNKAADVPVEASVERGRASEPKPDGPGRYRFSIDLPEETSGGLAKVRAGPVDGSFAAEAPLEVLSRRRPLGLSLGLTATAHRNVHGASGLTPFLDLGLRPARFPLEIVAEGGYAFYTPVRGSYPL